MTSCNRAKFQFDVIFSWNFSYNCCCDVIERSIPIAADPKVNRGDATDSWPRAKEFTVFREGTDRLFQNSQNWFPIDIPTNFFLVCCESKWSLILVISIVDSQLDSFRKKRQQDKKFLNPNSFAINVLDPDRKDFWGNTNSFRWSAPVVLTRTET